MPNVSAPPAAASLFAYPELRKFLRYVAKHCKTTTLGAWDGGNALILRHDVDLDIAAAHRFAEIERECGVRSTFFFLTTAHWYNPASADNRKLLRALADWGFEVGLHFDPSVYGHEPAAALRRRARAEAALLGSITGTPVRSISIHNPSVHGKYPLFAGFRNAYDPAIFAPEVYLSDSRMALRRDPYEFALLSRTRPVQLLLHPMHFTETGGSYPEIFYRHIRAWLGVVDGTFGPANEVYRRATFPSLAAQVERLIRKERFGR